MIPCVVFPAVFPGFSSQGTIAIAIGNNAGRENQGAGAVVIGITTEQETQGTNAIAIGQVDGQTSQPANSIVINASGVILNGASASACYVKPLRIIIGTPSIMSYDPSTFEVAYSTRASTNFKTFVINHPDKEDHYLVHACFRRS